MKKLLSLIIAVITFYGCQDDILSEEYQENVPATRASEGSSDYYWCDGVKIPLTVNENKSYVLVETAKFESVRNSAITNRSGLGTTRTIENHAALGIRSSKKAGLQKSLTSFTLDNAQQKSINPQDVVYEAPYFKTSDGADLGITNVFSVQLTGEQDLAKLQKIAEEYNLEILGENEFDPEYLLSFVYIRSRKGMRSKWRILCMNRARLSMQHPSLSLSRCPTPFRTILISVVNGI